jgi:ketosteroid isomerase-like protein
VNSITLETMVLRRDADGWRIVHIHWSSRKPK